VLNVGPGSPTGMSFGHHSNFPWQFHDKLFICDWTFGTIFTVQLQESGSSYTGAKTEFLNGTPLNIAAMRFGPDGHMYFVTGGRNTDSKLYRVRYTGPQITGPPKPQPKNQSLRDLRRSLEKFHGVAHISRLVETHHAAINAAWPHLSHNDRNIRYAARLAIENTNVKYWQHRVLAETDPRTLIYGAIALARSGDRSLADGLLAKLNGIDFGKLQKADQLALLRAYSLCFTRLAPTSPAVHKRVIDRLDPHYPATDEDLNTELCRVLSYLDAPTVVKKTIALMKVTQTKTMAYDKKMLTRHEYGKEILKTMANTPNVQNIHYAYCLRRVQNGWTLDHRKFYFGWLKETLTKSGGKSFAGSIRGIRQDAIAHLPEKDAATVSWLLGEVGAVDLGTLPTPKGPAVVWTVDSAMKLFDDGLNGRDYGNGKKMFAAGRCVACHRFQGSGGYSGPDLGSVAQRYSTRDILTSIIQPSDSISEQYQGSTVTLKTGKQLSGRVIYTNDTETALAENPYDFGAVNKIPAADIKKVEPLQVSLMPPGTIYPMNADELKDLVAYLVSGGDKKHQVFKKK
jgi:putative heme-binding domain-containing protein